jgi:UDP-N-acetyl-D-mannosaminuronic acid dehydrogenase
MVKLMENTYRDINIAIANEFSRLAERLGVDVWEAIQLANRHPRVNILNPGPGVGGHCISVDPWFLVESAPDISPLIRTARNLNDAQPAYVVEQINKKTGDLNGKKTTVLGLAYKPNVDDLRESPAISIARGLAHLGALVTAYEPYKVDAQIPTISTVRNLKSALAGCDIMVGLVAHSPIKDITPEVVLNFTNPCMVFDAANIWDDKVWTHAGFKFYSLGVGIE